MARLLNKVVICGVDTSTLPTLGSSEMREMLQKIKDGDKETREAFIFGNLRLVLSVIQRFYNRGEQVDDLFQIGCIGLIKAIDNFDLSHNVRFSTYAVPMNVPCRNPERNAGHDPKTRIAASDPHLKRGRNTT